MPPDIRSRLSYLADRKRRQEQLMEDVRAGKYDGMIADASSHFAREAAKPPREEQLQSVLPYAVPREGRFGRTLVCSFTINPEEPASAPYAMPPGGSSPPSPEAFHHLSADFRKGELVEPGEVCFLDTETTGLAGGTGTVAFLVGIGWWEQVAGKWCFRLEQYLIDDYCHEADQMERIAQRLAQFASICTYNGKSFDIPLLRSRAILQRIPPRVFAKRHLDLLHFSRRLWSQVLPSVSLKEVERSIIGFDRGPDLNGALIPEIFFHMARTGNAGRMQAVLDHNAWDILTLSSLLHRLCTVAADPLGCGLLQHPEELAAVARWFETRRQHADAARAWTRAVECHHEGGDRESWLMDRLARALKRLRRWEEAVETWEELRTRRGPERLTAWVELAKYHEHRRRDEAAALEIVRQARRALELESELRALTSDTTRGDDIRLGAVLADFEKREQRLRRRLDAPSRAKSPRVKPT